MNKSSAQTRAQIVAAAIETLQNEGFAGASSRAIARRGSFNQALIFYHYGSLEGVLVAALEQTSAQRLVRYRELIEPLDSLDDLLRVLAQLHDEDRASGHLTVVSQMIAGSLTRPELAPRVLEHMQPWLALAEETISRLLPPILPAANLANAAVTYYLGVNLLSTLDPQASPIEPLLTHAATLTPLLEHLASPSGE